MTSLDKALPNLINLQRDYLKDLIKIQDDQQSSLVSKISDWWGGASQVDHSIWADPSQLLDQAESSYQKGDLNNSQILLEQAKNAIKKAQGIWNKSVQSSIASAGKTIRELEDTRDLAFVSAAGLAAVPVVTLAAGALATAGVTSLAATAAVSVAVGSSTGAIVNGALHLADEIQQSVRSNGQKHISGSHLVTALKDGATTGALAGVPFQKIFLRVVYNNPVVREIASKIVTGAYAEATEKLTELGWKVLNKEEAKIFYNSAKEVATGTPRKISSYMIGFVEAAAEEGSQGAVSLGALPGNFVKRFFFAQEGKALALHELKHVEQVILRGAEGLYPGEPLFTFESRLASGTYKFLSTLTETPFLKSELLPDLIQVAQTPIVQLALGAALFNNFILPHNHVLSRIGNRFFNFNVS